MRTYELLMTGRVADQQFRADVEGFALESEIIVADNVFRMFCEYADCGREPTVDLPCCLPPFVRTVVDFQDKASALIYAVPVNHQTPATPQDIANIIAATDMPAQSHLREKNLDSAASILSATVFVSDGKAAAKTVGIFYAFLSQTGSCVATVSAISKQHRPESRERVQAALEVARYVACLAFNIASCKNVTLTVQRRPAAQARSLRKKYGVPETRFHTITLAPSTRKILTEAGKKSSSELGAALHLQRGHFKDYRDPQTKPLFGKHRGIWWWGQHLRGNSDLGVVEKDYIVTGAGK